MNILSFYEDDISVLTDTRLLLIPNQIIDGCMLNIFPLNFALRNIETNIDDFPEFDSLKISQTGYNNQYFFKHLSELIYGFDIKHYEGRSISNSFYRNSYFKIGNYENRIDVLISKGILYDQTNNKILLALMLPVKLKNARLENSTVTRDTYGRNIHVWVNRDIYKQKHPAYKSLMRHINKLKNYMIKYPHHYRFFVNKDNETMNKIVSMKSILPGDYSKFKELRRNIIDYSIAMFNTLRLNETNEEQKKETLEYIENLFTNEWIYDSNSEIPW